MNRKQEQTWYRSKVDWWLAPLLCVPPVAAISVCVAAFLRGDTTELLIGLAVAGAVAALYLGVIFPIAYGIDNDHLTIRFGFFRQRIPLSEILQVSPTRNPLSSPALSLDRLYIQYGKGFFQAVMISPANREQFLIELADRADLSREGGRLVRNRSAGST